MCNVDKIKYTCGDTKVVKVNKQCEPVSKGLECGGETVDKWEPDAKTKCPTCEYSDSMVDHHYNQYLDYETNRDQED